MDKKVLSQKDAKKFSKEILAKWKSLDDEENKSYLEQNFDQIWGN